MRVLVVDDDKDMAELLRVYCVYEKLECEIVFDGESAIKKLQKDKFDIIILDVMMPKMDGLGTIEKIRSFSNIPVIFLSAKTEENDKLEGFSKGADDYIEKPFSPKEVIARIKALHKRTSGKTIESDVIQKDGLLIEKKSRTVSIDKEEIKLKPKEYELLLYFVLNEKIVLTREQILDSVWGYDYLGDLRTVDTHIKTLRESLGEGRGMIKTVWGVGYKFET